MKTVKLLIAYIVAAFQMLAIPIASTAVIGCASSKQAVAYKSIASVQSSVEFALAAWVNYVASKRVEIDQMEDGAEKDIVSVLLSSREAKARAALEAYKTVAISAAGMAKSGSAPASEQLVFAAENFVSLTKN